MAEINLREQLFTYLSFLPKNEMRYVVWAYELAKGAHHGQVRESDERYFEHVRAVAMIMVRLGIHDWRVFVMSLLHDSWEDSWMLPEDLTTHIWGSEVSDGIKVLTKRKGVDYHESLRVCETWQVLLTKLGDRLHNLSTLKPCSQAKKERQVSETREHYIPLADQLIGILADDDKPWAKTLKKEIEKQCTRWS